MMLALCTVSMAPLPICALVSVWQSAVLDMWMVRLDDPGVVITDFGIIPDVVIAVVWIVDGVPNTYMSRATGKQGGAEQKRSEESCTEA
jgi:hypothetical protein